MNIPFVLTIAGHDPSGGAGFTSDVKTFEFHQVYGLSVATALTIQNDSEFESVNWVDDCLIIDQIQVLLKKYVVEVAKIGLIRNLYSLKLIVKELLKFNPDIKIIWDPILKSSSGFDFHQDSVMDPELLNQLFLVTPNLSEYEQLKSMVDIANSCHWLIKGGHRKNKKGTDVLISGGKDYELEGDSFKGKSKHGTGCVLSSSIAALLAKGEGLKEACRLGKIYVERFILSEDGNLGVHHHFEN